MKDLFPTGYQIIFIDKSKKLRCKKNILCSVLFLSLFFSACKKEDTGDSGDYKTLGTAAHELLAAAPYSKLQIEIQYMPGYTPDTVSVNSLVNFLQQHL